MEFYHDANSAMPLFIEVDGPGAVELEYPVGRLGGIKFQLGGDMLLDITLQWLSVREVAEMSVFYRITLPVLE